MAKKAKLKAPAKSGKGRGSARLNDDIGEEKRLEMFQMQLEVRHLENRANDLFLQNLVKGTIHLSVGMEAVAAGCGAAPAASAPCTEQSPYQRTPGGIVLPYVCSVLRCGYNQFV